MTRVAPAKVRKEAKLGLMLHKKWKRGGTAVGVARAVQLSSGKAVSDATIKRMYSYFQRHQHDRLDKDGSDGSIPGRGYIAWLLWGGYSGRKWAESEYKKIKKEKNPISKPVKKIKEDLAKKTVYLMKVSLDDFRSEPWAQDMVTKEEDFEVVDNYDDNGEPIFKTSEYVLSVVPKKYLQDFEFLRRMQIEGKLEKHSFSSAARAWLENDQPLDWFNEQAHDRGYLTKDEYLFLVKVNNPTIQERVKQKKEYFIELAKECKLKPVFNTKDGRLLSNYLMSDKKFKEKMKELCPQWFENDKGPRKQTIYSMEKIREIAKSGEKRPSNTSKNLEEKKLGIIISNLFAIYPDFRNEIFSLRPDWFRSEERKMFAEYKEENPYKMSNPARNVANVEDVKKFCERALEEFDEQLGYNADADRYLQTNIMQWFRSNFFKGIMNSERTQDYFIDLNEDNYQEIYFEHTGNYEWPDFVEKSIREGKKIEFFYPRVREGYFPSFSIEHFADFFNSGDFPANPSRVSYDQMIDLVLQWDEKDVKVSDDSKIAEGEVVFKEYSDGMKWVLLTNKQAIENESRISRMGHCIGRTGEEETNFYIDKIVDGTGYTFSLRDKENHPYVTCFYELMESSEEDSTEIGLFTQIKGYKNCHINTIAYHQVDKKDRKGIEKLRCSDLPKINSNEKYVIDLIKDEKLEKLTRCKHNTNLSLECDDLFENADFVSFKILTNYAEVDIYDNFAENLERKILTNEQFERFDLKKLNIPNAAIFDIKFNSKTKLPDNLIIFAPTGFDTLDLKALPSNLKIIGNLSLDVPLTSIGHNIIVEGDLLLRDDLNKSHAAFADKIDARNKISAKLKKKRNPLKLIARGIDERPASAYDREELKLGLKTELEHTDDAIIASKIAKDHLDEDPHYYSKLVEMERGMKSNPVTPESEEYLYIIQNSIKGHAPGIDAWVDEESGDILVGWMAFEEDRSFDDVLVRVKTSGRILKGKSVDDSTKKSAEKLMKKIHKDLVSYITNKKSNPVPAGVDPKEFDSLVEKLKKRKDVDNPYALANWILKQKNPTAYEKLVKQLAAKGVDDPKALAAWIGRQKYGKEEFQRRAAAGKRRKKNPITSANEIDAIKEELNDILRSEKNV